jgi:lambda family phage portal protein
LNWFDKAIATVSPETALRRVRARVALGQIQRLAYDAASSGRRLDGWMRAGTSANAEVGGAIKTLRDSARDLVRNYPLARKGLWEYKTKIVGTGIRPQWKTGDKAIDAILDSVFEQVAPQINADGRPGYYGMQSLGIGCMAEAGEALLRRRFRVAGDGPEATLPNRKTVRIPLQIQLLEPDFLDHTKTHQTDTGYIIQGVEFNKIGKRVGYWLYGAHPGDVVNTNWFGRGSLNSAFVPASEIEHGYIPERIGQVRGVSWFASVITAMHDLDSYQDAERVRKKVEACLAAFVSQPDNDNGTLADAATNTQGQRIESFEPGMVVYTKPGSSVTTSEPKAAGGYSEYVRTEHHAIAAGMLLLYAVLTGDLSQTNYSSYRGGALSLKSLIELIQWEYAIPFMCDTPARWFLDACKIAGIVPEDTPYGVEWGPPAFELLDREAEADADNAEMRNGTMTLFQAIARKGYDPKKQIAEIAEINKLLDANGIVLDCDPRKVAKTGANQKSDGGGKNAGNSN